MIRYLALTFDAQSLRTVDLLPLLMRRLMEIDALRAHRERLFTILAELTPNALDYGVLGLDATLKSTPRGFLDYYMAREKALATLQTGWLSITVDHTPIGQGGRLVVRLVDSGPGFDYHHELPEPTSTMTLRGRGILLLRSLCTQLVYRGKGNDVEATYEWE